MEVMRRFVEEGDNIVDRLYRESGDKRKAVASAESRSDGLRKRTEACVRVIERELCRM